MAVIRRAATIVLVLAIGVQMLPLRVCALEQIVTGSSCHGENDHHAPLPAHPHDGWAGHADSGGRHDHACRCEMPKSELNRNVPVIVCVDWLPAIFAPFDLQAGVHSAPSCSAREAPPDGASGAVTFPLLN